MLIQTSLLVYCMALDKALLAELARDGTSNDFYHCP